MAATLLGGLVLLAGPLPAQGLPEGDPEELGLSPTRLQRLDNLITTAIDAD